MLKLKEHERATFFSPSENRCLLASNLKLEERDSVVDSGASLHVISKKDLSVAEMCEECESCHDRTGRPVVEGQSNPLFVPSLTKANMPLTDDDPARKEFLLQRYAERIEKLSQQDRVSKFCFDAGFLTTVEVGQYFMTKDTEEFSQFTDSGS